MGEMMKAMMRGQGGDQMDMEEMQSMCVISSHHHFSNLFAEMMQQMGGLGGLGGLGGGMPNMSDMMKMMGMGGR